MKPHNILKAFGSIKRIKYLVEKSKMIFETYQDITMRLPEEHKLYLPHGRNYAKIHRLLIHQDAQIIDALIIQEFTGRNYQTGEKGKTW